MTETTDPVLNPESAEQLLTRMASVYAKGESDLLAAAVEAGAYADRYVSARLALGDKRSEAVKAVEGRLAEVGGTVTKANDLIGVYHAVRLLAAGGDTGKLRLGHVREGFKMLVRRENPDTPQEQWVMLPGFEDECRALFAEAVSAGWSRPACVEKCQELVRRHDAELAKCNALDARTRAEKAAAAAAEAETPEAREELEEAADAAREAAEKAAERAADAELLGTAPRTGRTRKTPAKHDRDPQPLPTCISVAKAAGSAQDLGQLLADMAMQADKDVAEIVGHFAACLDWSPRVGAAFVKGLARSESPSTAWAMHKMLLAVLPPSQTRGQLAKVG